jgi:hypothetical protein
LAAAYASDVRETRGTGQDQLRFLLGRD